MGIAEIEIDVLVIGAGVAGLTAGRAIAEAGRKVMVVEARDRIGGRVFTVSAAVNAAAGAAGGGEPVELGAEFVHGRPEELWALIEEAGLSAYELDGEELCRREDGRLEPCGSGLGEDFDWIERLKGWQGKDCSFAKYLELAEVPEEQRARLISYVEGFNAADHREIGVAALGRQQEAEDEIEADRLFHVEGGYGQVPEFLANRFEAAGGRVLLEHLVTQVVWERGRVQVGCESPEGPVCITARKVVVTLPLGVLQAGSDAGSHLRAQVGSVRWSPEPVEILEAAARMRMGQAQRAVLLFGESPAGEVLAGELAANADSAAAVAREKSGELRGFGFLFAYGKIPPVWWTQYPHRSKTLTGWVGGPRTESWRGLAAGEIRREAVATLAGILGVDAGALEADLAECHTHDWRLDPFALGAYSYVPAGAMGASEQMCEPQDDTLFFAGEHTDTTGHWGTVHGAMRSGLRVAMQVLAS